MPDVRTPVTPKTTTQKERRCVATVGRNNLDVSLSSPPSLNEIAAKYELELHCVDEPQDAARIQTGPRETVAVKLVPIEAMLSRTFSAAGITATGAQILALYNEIVDAYKGD